MSFALQLLEWFGSVEVADTAVTPNFYHAGFPKSATTWLHRCLREHPEIFVPKSDAIHYLTTHFDQGPDWLRPHYEDYRGQKIIGDTTPSYAAFDWARQRMVRANPDARILITIRNPIDRAWSHFYHMQQKRGYPQHFEEALEQKVDLYHWLISLGFYGHHLQDLFRFFDRSQVCVLTYEQIVEDPLQFCREVFTFLEVDPDFQPASVFGKVNTATRVQARRLPWLLRPLLTRSAPRSYTHGPSPDTKARLRRIFQDDVRLLEELLNRDFSHWLDESE